MGHHSFLELANGTNHLTARYIGSPGKEPVMNRIIYIVGLVVIVIAILSFFGLR